MISLRKAGLAAVLLLTLMWLGCGDVFRPVATPILNPGGDPALPSVALVINNNNGDLGSTTHINVSGDTNVGNHPVGRGPVHATFNLSRSFVYIANFNDDTVSFYSPTIAQAGSPSSTIALPAGSRPAFITACTSTTTCTGAGATAVFVANSGTNTVGVIRNNALVSTVPVGPHPVALAETPDAKKLYCVNQGDGTVTVISAIDNSVIGTIAVGSSPVWAVASPDSSTVYVVNQDSDSVSVIKTATDTKVADVPVGTAPSHLFFDNRLNRIYVANTGSDNVSVFDISTGSLAPLATISVGAAGSRPVSITALADGSRAYVANSGNGTVSVIDLVGLKILHPPVSVGTTPVWIASPGDNSRVIVVNRDSDSISDIRTSDDTVVATTPSGSPRPVFVMISK